MQSMQGTGAGAGAGRFVYDGRLGELYVIFIKNVLLTIVTLGIYRFWAKTRMRRYLWSHTSLFGDRFEYTGAGKELFLGFLIALGLFILFGAVFAAVTIALGETAGQVMLAGFYTLVFFLFFVARFTALRYRLSRTRWRGIRGGLGGSPWRFAWLSVGWNIVNLLTAGLLGPVVTIRTLGYRIRNAFFGTARAGFSGQARDFYGRFIVYYFSSAAIAIVGLAIAVGIAYAIGAGTEISELFADRAPGEQPPPRAIAIMILGIYAVAFFVGLLMLPVVCWYYSFLYNYLLRSTDIAGIRFGGTVSTWGMFGYLIVNLLIMVTTLGLGFPWVMHRVMTFISANVVVEGAIDPETVRQSQMSAPRTGEGLLEMLDTGVI